MQTYLPVRIKPNVNALNFLMCKIFKIYSNKKFKSILYINLLV